jgi:Uma2 family endonuclease
MTNSMHSFPTPPRSRDLVTDDGEPMESARHRQQMEVLIQSLELAWADRNDFYAGGNMFLYFSETQARKNDFRGPDFFVVLGTDRHERRAWVVWEEDGKAPDVIVELLSETTEHVDRGEKMRVYARSLKVAEYFLFDPWSGVLEGYELDSPRGVYRRKELDAKGRVHCDQVGLWLGKAKSVLYGVEVEWLRWMDDEGNVFLHPEEKSRVAEENLRAAEEHLKAVREQANAVLQKATAAEEKATAAEEKATAAEEKATAEAARAHRLALEVEELRRKLDGR